MADQFVGEIRMFAGNFAPAGWALCNGQIMPLAQNTALFSLLGTNFGGDGKTNFALPNLQGAVAIGTGQGSGLSPRVVGETGGSTTVTLLTSEIPAHTHTPNVGAATADSDSPFNAVWAVPPGRRPVFAYGGAANMASMNAAAIQPAGGSAPHNNMQPYLSVTFIIALQGIFPSRA